MTRRFGLVAGAIALVLLVMPATQASAAIIGTTGMLNQVKLPAYNNNNTGEFTIYDYTNLTNAGYTAGETSDLEKNFPNFETFCLELDESTAANPMYFVIGSAAVEGGQGGPSPDPISEGTAYLYSEFVKGSFGALATTFFAGTRAIEAELLQLAIWALEEEITAPLAGVNPYYDLALLNGGMTDAAPGYLNVYVLNNYYDRTLEKQVAQDFLYYEETVPDGGATLMLLGGALIGLGALRRKFNG